MRLGDIIKKAGGAAISAAFPGVGHAVVSVVNQFLPDDKKITEQDTGEHLEKTISALPLDVKLKLLQSEIDLDVVEVEQANESLRSMLVSDSKSQHTTRPYIAKHSFHVVAFVVCLVVLTWSYSVVTADTELTKAVLAGWQFVLAIIGPFITLLWAYFGILKKENQNKLDSANGLPTSNFLSTLMGRLKK